MKINELKKNSAAITVAEVKVVKKSVFAFKKRAEIAPKGFQPALYDGAVNEVPESGDAFNRVVSGIKLEAKNSKSQQFLLSKTYNLLGRGAAAFVEDHNAWTGAGLTEDDLYDNFDGNAEKGKQLVVEVGHRKVGKEWEAFIKGFHPPGYSGEPAAEGAEAVTA